MSKVKNFIFSLILTSFVLPSFALSSEALAEEDLSKTCDLDSIETQCNALGSTQCRQLLEKCEAYYKAESEKIESDLNKTGQEKKNLQSQITSLQKKIKNLFDPPGLCNPHKIFPE